MTVSNFNKIIVQFFSGIACLWITAMVASCGKQSVSSPTGLNIKYQVINLSPDVYPIDLYIKFIKTNTNPFTYNVRQGYFYVPYTDTPYQIKPNRVPGTVLFNRDDVLKSGLTYSLFITGNKADSSLLSIFTVDTATAPAIGRGKVRFLNASPDGKAGFDVFANGTKAFSKVSYPSYSKFLELPNGNYDFQIKAPGSTAVTFDLKNVTIQDGRLYTIYAYGYTTRADSASFAANYITNK